MHPLPTLLYNLLLIYGPAILHGAMHVGLFLLLVTLYNYYFQVRPEQPEQGGEDLGMELEGEGKGEEEIWEVWVEWRGWGAM
ncbi:hypothetical protein M409DRAFT_24859 [Zasmidium cellare ATCC 36951]|uniref:Uncharacterized protein n=1 Tax=Zasmidium cellare ATCC 36951 TaxID=1080233 RepID=A0A6A6CFM3_ZASCE|nr:uncharacterized protein M409DRAFT_24859 [Zasmidium cellare ATCC 36951]KAF2164958.1 hypothetical protein M409DRAFT_24859 [Zasmidium cellare ATCC 36951]